MSVFSLQFSVHSLQFSPRPGTCGAWSASAVFVFSRGWPNLLKPLAVFAPPTPSPSQSSIYHLPSTKLTQRAITQSVAESTAARRFRWAEFRCSLLSSKRWPGFDAPWWAARPAAPGQVRVDVVQVPLLDQQACGLEGSGADRGLGRLCSSAASGIRPFVSPPRLGRRHGPF